MVEQIFTDVKVLDLTWCISGPYCTKVFADYGADVIKVEKPGSGEPASNGNPGLLSLPRGRCLGQYHYQ